MELLATVEGSGFHRVHSQDHFPNLFTHTNTNDQNQNTLEIITKNLYWLSECFHNNLLITSLCLSW
jgi:hypothetical protein